MAPHSSTLAWKIPWREEPGRLQSMRLLIVRHDWATSLSLFTSCIGNGNGNPLQCSCLENPRDRGAWWAAVYGAAQSQTWLKQLSSSSSSGKESTYQCRRCKKHRFDPWVGKIPWKRAGQLMPVFLPGESHSPGRLQLIGLQKVRHNWSNLAGMHGAGKLSSFLSK